MHGLQCVRGAFAACTLRACCTMRLHTYLVAAPLVEGQTAHRRCKAGVLHLAPRVTLHLVTQELTSCCWPPSVGPAWGLVNPSMAGAL